MRIRFSFFLLLHQLKSNYNALIYGSQQNTPRNKSLSGDEIATDTTEFALPMSQLTFVNTPSHILLLASWSFTTDHGSR